MGLSLYQNLFSTLNKDKTEVLLGFDFSKFIADSIVEVLIKGWVTNNCTIISSSSSFKLFIS